jgi:hypothetical protein
VGMNGGGLEEDEGEDGRTAGGDEGGGSPPEPVGYGNGKDGADRGGSDEEEEVGEGAAPPPVADLPRRRYWATFC